ncbi:MAG: SGNH/GDSL hydrolase family protein [Synechococcaceae cyanobacterium]|nr:SGNH/GDSL hydrolase family protein [Synechococcaceae cyanobacterium]
MATCFSLSPFGSPAVAQVTSLSHLYVFGDSLSDSGNSGANSFGLFTPPPYAQNRFTNGPVAVEYLWEKFNPGNNNFKPSLLGGTNFAIGGASTGLSNQLETGQFPGPPLNALYANKGNAWQLDNLGQPSFDPATSLFMLWLFPNDPLVFQSTGGNSVGTYSGTPGGPIQFEQIPALAVDNIIGSLQELVGKGARKFFVVNSPDLGTTPLFANTPNQAVMTDLSSDFNALLESSLASYASATPQVSIRTFKVDQLLNSVIANPSAYGFTNVSSPCFTMLTVCPNPNDYLFWDQLHPTTKAHGYLADAFYSTVYTPPSTPVPGPLPAAGGLAALGWSRRLKQRLRRREHGLAARRVGR